MWWKSNRPASARFATAWSPSNKERAFEMSRRKSIHIGNLKHVNPIQNACRIGNLLMSGVVLGRDPATGIMPERIEDQCANIFAHMKTIVEAGGGSTEDIIKVTVWLQDRN